jgi:hypothetical protein
VLEACSRSGDAAGIATALDALAPVRMRTSAGETPLQLAAGVGAGDAVELLMTRGAVVADADKTGVTALHAAAAGGHAAVVSTLLAAGADVNAKTKGAQSALQFAAARGYPAVCKALLAAGSEVDRSIYVRRAYYAFAMRLHAHAASLHILSVLTLFSCHLSELRQGRGVPLHAPRRRRCVLAVALMLAALDISITCLLRFWLR